MIDVIERLQRAETTPLAGAESWVELWQVLGDARAEIERLRSQPCPYVTGSVTHYCTLTPFTLTDAEREAVKWALGEAVWSYNPDCGDHPDTLRRLLTRMSL